MIIHALLVVAGAVSAAVPPAAVAPPKTKAPARTEQQLREKLASMRAQHAFAAREAILGGGAEELRDAVASGHGAQKRELADRLPGMARDPFDVCRDLKGCHEAPSSFHVEEDTLVDDAFVALARPWIKLQEARGKQVKVTVDPGVGVKLELEDLPARPTVTLEAMPTPTGGFDVALADPKSVQDFAAARAAALGEKQP